MTEKMTPKRRSLRFSVRTLMVAVTLCAVWLGYHLNWIRARREAGDWIEEREVSGAIGYARETRPDLPWSLQLFGEEPRRRILVGELDSDYKRDYTEGVKEIERLFPEAQVVAFEWSRSIDDEEGRVWDAMCLPAARPIRDILRQLKVYSEEDYQTLSLDDRFVWDIYCFDTEVSNGGIHQYLYSSSGNHWANCLKALRVIGASQSETRLRTGCNLFPERPPSDELKMRRQQLRKICHADVTLDEMVKGEFDTDHFQRLLNYLKKRQESYEHKR